MSANRVFTFPAGVWLSRTLAPNHQIQCDLSLKHQKQKARDWDIVNESDEEDEEEREERHRKRPRSAGGLKALENLEKKPSAKARRSRSKDKGRSLDKERERRSSSASLDGQEELEPKPKIVREEAHREIDGEEEERRRPESSRRSMHFATVWMGYILIILMGIWRIPAYRCCSPARVQRKRRSSM